jgi:hypothetical protein
MLQPDPDAGKREKSSVNYRHATDSAHRCKTCRYSYGPLDDRRCRLVKGRIYPDDTCDLWEAKRE